MKHAALSLSNRASRGLALARLVISTFGCTLVATGVPGLFILLLPTYAIYPAVFLLIIWMYVCAYKCTEYFAGCFLYDREDHAELQVLGWAIDGAALDRFLGGKVTPAGKRTGWPLAKLSASRDTLRVQTSFGTFSWDKADRPLITRGVGWAISNGLSEGAGDISFGTFYWKAVAVERKLEDLGYAVRSRYAR